MRRLLPALLLAALAALSAAPAQAEADPGALCEQAIAAAERAHGLPDRLLLAIGRVESGRAHPRTGRITPWPWTINAEGQGRHLASRGEAVAAVQALQARGVRVIDVGCMQVNLHHHPEAFASLEDAFDPAANARYAGLFLKRLHAARGDWELAATHYHSATPERAEAYRLRLMAHWPGVTEDDGRHNALAAAWAAGRIVPLRGNGFQARALALAERPALHGRGPSLLDPVPDLRVAQRRVQGRPLVEVAEAPPARR